MLLWVALVLALWWSFPKRVGGVWMADGSARSTVSLPWHGQGQTEVHQFDVEVLGSAHKLSVRADDCVERIMVGDRTLFSAEPKAGLHRAYTEFRLPALWPGSHTLRFAIRGFDGKSWFDIKEAHGFGWLKAAVLIGWGYLAFGLARRCGYPAWVGWPVAVAGLLALQYLDVTTPWVRQHDVGAHREYITYLSTHKALPPMLDGWETWQPPLYYIVAGLWRIAFSGFSFDDSFRPVQFLAAAVYLAGIAAIVPMVRRLRLSSLEAVGSVAALALVPAHLFLAGRINNDVLLPVLGAGVMFTTAEFVRFGSRCWLWWLAGLLPAMLATKGSSLAMAGGALAMVLWAERRRSGWQPALFRAYLTGLPAGLWQAVWCLRSAAQTGDLLYMNAGSLPESLRLHGSRWYDLISFHLGAFVGGATYYDHDVRHSYPTALLTSVLQGEYGLHEYAFRCPGLLRLGCLGLLSTLVAGAVVPPRSGLRPLWITCLVLAGCQAALCVTYAAQFRFACNQDARFYAQVFAPVACLFGLGLGRAWNAGGWAGRFAASGVGAVFLVGLVDLYGQILFW